jgi:hypothetical protein
MFQTKVLEKNKTHFIFSDFFESLGVYEIMWKNITEPVGHIARWIPKAHLTHSQYIIFIAFPLQQWLHERASMLRYTYIACLDLIWG